MITSEDAPIEAWMLAVESRDARFDGWVIVGVTSTGIYCRPSCPTPVRPKRANMAFFPTPASAQSAGFRACKRCAPDSSPGSPEWNRRDDMVARAIRAVDDGVVDREGVEGLARRLHVSSRHLHRLLSAELGVGPLALARARRARTARALIETTDLAFSDLAFAAGFESIRQFNDTIREVFAMSPTQLRSAAHKRAANKSAANKSAANKSAARGRTASPRAASDAQASQPWISLRLGVREPFAVDQVWQWLASHAVEGIEEVDGNVFRRSLRFDGGSGVVELEPVSSSGGQSWIEARFQLDRFADLASAVQSSRRLLDLDADPRIIDEALMTDARLGALVAQQPGLRSPGDVSGADATIRAVLHQQVSVASARSMAGRLVSQLGERLAEPVGKVTTVFPPPEVWAEANPDDLGLTASRAATVVRIADAIATGDVDVSPLADRAASRQQLLAVKGIGPWTASIVSLRGLADPDAFTTSDLALNRVAADIGIAPLGDAKALDSAAAAWQPWRSYAMHHLWRRYATGPTERGLT